VDYWERNLDPDLFVDRSLTGAVKDKVVLITGASAGIGKAAAIKIAEAGAKTLIVARTEEKLLETQREIEARGGKAFIYTADVADIASCDALIQQVLADHGGVDILINTLAAPSAGPSKIRWTASMTTSAPCNSTTSARCG